MSIWRSTRSSTNRRMRQFDLKHLLLVVVVCSVVFTLLHFVLRAVAIARRSSGVHNFRIVHLALETYGDVNGHLPAPFSRDKDGQPACSWRFVTMVFWDRGHFAEMPRPDLSWTAPPNALWVPMRIDTLCFVPNSCTTSVAAITGRNTAFDPDRQRTLTELPNDIILIIEVRDLGVHWMQPGDLEMNDLARSSHLPDATSKLFGTARDCFVVGFADSEVWVLTNTLPIDETDGTKYTLCGRDLHKLGGLRPGLGRRTVIFALTAAATNGVDSPPHIAVAVEGSRQPTSPQRAARVFSE